MDIIQVRYDGLEKVEAGETVAYDQFQIRFESRANRVCRQIERGKKERESRMTLRV